MSQHTGSYIHLFKTIEEYDEARNNHYEEPWVGYCIQGSGYSYNSAATPTPTAELTISGPSTAPSTGGTFTINVTSNTGWTLVTEVGTLSPTTGTNTGQSTLTLEENESEENLEFTISAFTRPGNILKDHLDITQYGGEEPPGGEVYINVENVDYWPFVGSTFDYTGDTWGDICESAYVVWEEATDEQSPSFPVSDGLGYKVTGGENEHYVAAIVAEESEGNYAYVRLGVYDEQEGGITYYYIFTDEQGDPVKITTEDYVDPIQNYYAGSAEGGDGGDEEESGT